jgi:hypothetical protein
MPVANSIPKNMKYQTIDVGNYLPADHGHVRCIQLRLSHLYRVRPGTRSRAFLKHAMKKIFPWILVAVAVAALALVLTGDNGEQRVLDRLEEIRALTEVRDQENPLTRLARAKQLSTLFMAQTYYDLTTLDHGTTSINSRDELAQRIVAGRSKLVSLELTLLAPQVQIDGDQATVRITATALGAVRGGEGQFMDVHTVEIELVREGGDWLVSGGRHIRDERAAPGNG